MKKYLLLSFFALYSINTLAQTNLSEQIEQLVNDNLDYIINEDLNAAMSTVNSQSPNYESTRQILEHLFEAFDLKFEILEYNFVGSDGDYAYARVLQKTERVSGPEFNDNELDALQVFKKEGDKWKLWSQANLTVVYANE